MSKVYELFGDTKNYSSFLELHGGIKNSFFAKYSGWRNIDIEKYEPVVYKLIPNDSYKKNYRTDISTFSVGMIVFSERAVFFLREILEKSGQLLPVVTESKRKKFFGFYANKNIYDESIVDLGKSKYKQYENGKIFSEIVFNEHHPKNDYLFVLDSYNVGVFVTEKFKTLVDKHDLKGFSFQKEMKITRIENK